ACGSRSPAPSTGCTAWSTRSATCGNRRVARSRALRHTMDQLRFSPCLRVSSASLKWRSASEPGSPDPPTASDPHNLGRVGPCKRSLHSPHRSAVRCLSLKRLEPIIHLGVHHVAGVHGAEVRDVARGEEALVVVVEVLLEHPSDKERGI